MNGSIITTIAAAAGLLVALWTILSNFDKRNGDRFDALQKQIDSVRDVMQKQIDSTRDVLRAEMREMRAELRLEIKEAADRRVRG